MLWRCSPRGRFGLLGRAPAISLPKLSLVVAIDLLMIVIFCCNLSLVFRSLLPSQLDLAALLLIIGGRRAKFCAALIGLGVGIWIGLENPTWRMDGDKLKSSFRGDGGGDGPDWLALSPSPAASRQPAVSPPPDLFH